MKIVKKNIEFNNSSDVLYLYGIGDLHCASVGFDEGKFKKVVQEVKEEPHALWIGMGDYGESIPKSDRRFDQDSFRPKYAKNLHRMAQMEAEELKKLIGPIADKCCGLISGNHEDSLRKNFDFDLTWDLCNKFGIPYLTSQAFVRLAIKFGSIGGYMNVDIFAMHGYGGGRKWGGKVNKLADIASGIRADIYMMGHLHSQAVFKEVELSLPNRGMLRLVEKERIGILVPSFYRTYMEGIDTYASRFLYPPSILGWSKVNISYNHSGSKHDICLTTSI